MDMIKKIALTASTMLFVLTQIFSFYVIFTSRQEKIDLIKKQQEKIFTQGCSDVMYSLQKMNYADSMQDYVMTYCFRDNMPEGSALYKGDKVLYNSTSYDFDSSQVDFDKDLYPFSMSQEKIGDTHLLVLYTEQKINNISQKEKYIFFYIQDITFIYREGWKLAIQEIIICILASLVMALLLIVLIKKITKPLQATNEAQRQLIGSMSHELKTPLTAIKGYSETLLSVKLSQEQEEKALEYINRESGRLSRLSEKMMELTRLYEPECRIALEKVSVETLFATVKESVSHRLQEKNMILQMEGEFQDRNKMLDSDLMTSFLINLVNNSIMASEPESTIYLGADEHSLWVRDEGCGIPSEEIDKVRKAFYRVDKSRSRKSGNMGLGLALCEQIAAVHHGIMVIESEVGTGTKISWTEK
ncbi:MAG: HAMP domain-containing histidine kinase [Lachnospiraceae bacterium]|jgi:signal transduction histidine kinase|nr:HAMP domain-containing histidine kinase [Lachnospiraceae bacterium]